MPLALGAHIVIHVSLGSLPSPILQSTPPPTTHKQGRGGRSRAAPARGLGAQSQREGDRAWNQFRPLFLDLDMVTQVRRRFVWWACGFGRLGTGDCVGDRVMRAVTGAIQLTQGWRVNRCARPTMQAYAFPLQASPPPSPNDDAPVIHTPIPAPLFFHTLQPRQASGSAYLELEHTKVLCAVYGPKPRQVRRVWWMCACWGAGETSAMMDGCGRR